MKKNKPKTEKEREEWRRFYRALIGAIIEDTVDTGELADALPHVIPSGIGEEVEDLLRKASQSISDTRQVFRLADLKRVEELFAD